MEAAHTRRALKLEVVTYALGQCIRFASSLILSRLLFPEAFGLSVTVAVVNQGLQMISDVGVSQSVVQSRRGDEPAFLDTAWSVMAIRGVLLWLCASVLSWPLAHFLAQPQLLWLIPVGSLSVMIGGLTSTSLITCRRHLNLKPLMLIELGTQIIAFVVTVGLSWAMRSVWALIVGSLTSSFISAAVSYLVKTPHRGRLGFDRSSWAEIRSYGRWIQASSALSFASNQGDRLLMAHYVTMAVLGTYNFAVMLADAMASAVIRVTHGVFFPAFSQINRDNPAGLPEAFYKLRRRMDLLTLAPLGVLCAGSQLIIDTLFDPRYHDAGWMLRLLCVRAAMVCVLTPVETYLFSVGQTRFGFFRDLARSIWVLGGIPLAWYFAGVGGVVWVVALSELPVLIVLWGAFAKLGVLRWRHEAQSMLVFVATAVVAYGLISQIKSSALGAALSACCR